MVWSPLTQSSVVAQMCSSLGVGKTTVRKAPAPLASCVSYRHPFWFVPSSSFKTCENCEFRCCKALTATITFSEVSTPTKHLLWSVKNCQTLEMTQLGNGLLLKYRNGPRLYLMKKKKEKKINGLRKACLCCLEVRGPTVALYRFHFELFLYINTGRIYTSRILDH